MSFACQVLGVRIITPFFKSPMSRAAFLRAAMTTIQMVVYYSQSFSRPD
jgi:hypothetical protein